MGVLDIPGAGGRDHCQRALAVVEQEAGELLAAIGEAAMVADTLAAALADLGRPNLAEAGTGAAMDFRALRARLCGTPTAQPAVPVGIAAAPFAVFQDDAFSVTVERHDGPSPVRWTVDCNRIAAALEAITSGEA